MVLYSALQQAHKHRFGVLRAWVKGKCWDDGFPKTWADLRFRPLVSYLRHHWRSLLSLAGKCCSALVRQLQIGFGVESPRQVVESAHAWNRGARLGQGARASSGDSALSGASFQRPCRIALLGTPIFRHIIKIRLLYL